MGNSAKRDAKALELAERTAKAVRLRINGLTSYDAIAKECGFYDRSAARKAVHAAIREMCSEEDRQTLRAIEHARLNRLFLAAYPKALENDWKAHTACQAYDRAIRELNGLDDKQRVEVSGPAGGPILTADVSTLTDEQLESVIAGDFARAVAASREG